jgi:hypothetical protein
MSTDSPTMAPLTTALLKTLNMAPGHLDPTGITNIADNYGFQYRALTGMLIFDWLFQHRTAISILCKFNERPSDILFMAAKNCMRYLNATISRGLVYWCPTGRERSNLPHGVFAPLHSERSIESRFPIDLPHSEPVCFVDASYGGGLPIKENRSITGIAICLGGTAIFEKMRIQRTTALSWTEAVVIAGCDARKDNKYWRKIFNDLHFDINQPTYGDENNVGNIIIVNRNRPGGCNRYLDLQYFATREWVQ